MSPGSPTVDPLGSKAALVTLPLVLLLGGAFPGRAQTPCEQPAEKQGARLVLPVAAHNFGDVARKGGSLVHDFVFRIINYSLFTLWNCPARLSPRGP